MGISFQRYGGSIALASAAAVILTLTAYWLVRPPAERRAALEAREGATFVLGRHLAEAHPRAKCLILSNPFAASKGRRSEFYQFEQAGLLGLERGLLNWAKSASVVHAPIRQEYRQNPASAPIDPSTATPLSFLVSGADLDQLLAARSPVDIVVSLIGLPIDITQSRHWQDDQTPKYALLLPDLRVLGGSSAIRAAVRSGKIVAMILHRPGAPAEDLPSLGDARAEFDRRYLLVTPENLDAILQIYPNLF
jgi:hypothetical protein